MRQPDDRLPQCGVQRAEVHVAGHAAGGARAAASTRSRHRKPGRPRCPNPGQVLEDVVQAGGPAEAGLARGRCRHRPRQSMSSGRTRPGGGIDGTSDACRGRTARLLGALTRVPSRTHTRFHARVTCPPARTLPRHEPHTFRHRAPPPDPRPGSGGIGSLGTAATATPAGSGSAHLPRPDARLGRSRPHIAGAPRPRVGASVGAVGDVRVRAVRRAHGTSGRSASPRARTRATTAGSTRPGIRGTSSA